MMPTEYLGAHGVNCTITSSRMPPILKRGPLLLHGPSPSQPWVAEQQAAPPPAQCRLSQGPGAGTQRTASMYLLCRLVVSTEVISSYA